MSEETVTITIEVPKKLMNVLEQENYFNWKKEDFFVASIQRSISCEINEMHIDDVVKLREKYDFDPGLVVEFTERALVKTTS